LEIAVCDKCDIEYLINHCSELADAGEFVAYSELFRDGVMIGHDGVERGAEELLRHRREYNAGFGNVTPRTAHIITNIRIDLGSNKREASSRCYIMGFFLHEADKPLIPNYIGQYFDRFQKIDGQWRFRERRVAAIGELPPDFQRASV
jgi:hypothetical protein